MDENLEPLSREPRFFDRIFRILVEAKGGVGFAAEGAEIREGEQPCAHRATKGTEEQPVPATDLPRGRSALPGFISCNSCISQLAWLFPLWLCGLA